MPNNTEEQDKSPPATLNTKRKIAFWITATRSGNEPSGILIRAFSEAPPLQMAGELGRDKFEIEIDTAPKWRKFNSDQD